MEYRNPGYTAGGDIDVEMNHPEFGWIPFTVPASDPAFAGIVTGGNVAPYAPPADPPIEELRAWMRLTRRQLLIGLGPAPSGLGWITAAEGLAWSKGTALPADMLAFIATLPADQQYAAELTALTFTEAVRLDPMVVGLATMRGKTDAEVDALFVTYASV